MKVYISCSWSFPDGLDRVKKYLSNYVFDSITCNDRNSTYDPSLIQEADCVIFVLNNFKWKEKLENISRGVLSELVYCTNNKKSFYLAYLTTKNEIGIYNANISTSLVLEGVKETRGNIFKTQEIAMNLEAFGADIDYELKEDLKQTNNYFY